MGVGVGSRGRPEVWRDGQCGVFQEVDVRCCVSRLERPNSGGLFVQCCFTSTETVRMAISTFTQLLNSKMYPFQFSVAHSSGAA